MKKYIVLYKAPSNFKDMSGSMSSEDSKAEMDKWMEWGKKCGDCMVELGNPLGKACSMDKDSCNECTTEVAGYSILQAESMEEACKMCEGHPHFNMPGCTLDIHEEMPM